MGGCCIKNREMMEKINILVLGLSGSGKTEILHVLVNEARTDMSPTNGSRIFTRRLGPFQATFIEVGGNEDMRNIWHHYYYKAHGLIFVVDLSDEENSSAAYEMLSQVIQNPYAQGKSILVLANKTDLCEFPDILGFYERFSLEALANSYQSHILLQCVGHRDYTELFSGIDWLRFRIEIEYNQLKNRIAFDMRSRAIEEGASEGPNTIAHVRSFFSRARSAPPSGASSSTSSTRAKSAGALPRRRRFLRTNRVHSVDQMSKVRTLRKRDENFGESMELEEIPEKHE